jgi:stage V sporulation protein SpoVS
MRNQPIEMRLHKEQFDQINLHIASEVPFLSRVVDVVTRLSVVVSIFERKEIPCEVFTIDSACQHFHDRSAGEAIAKTMATLIEEEAASILSEHSSNLSERVEQELGCIGQRECNQHFKGHLVARRVVQRMVSELPVAIPYLFKVDKEKRKGIVRIVFVFSCFEKDASGAEFIAPQLVSGFEMEVDLPTKTTLPNPLHCTLQVWCQPLDDVLAEQGWTLVASNHQRC